MDVEVFQVKKITRAIDLTGKGTDQQWQAANTLTNFTYPWRSEKAPTTKFKALFDEQNFYFLYQATDPEIITKVGDLAEKAALNSDRVELFFKGQSDNDPYYSLELDALGRILDTKANFGQPVDFDWQWPKGALIVKASLDEVGYWVEGSISLQSLRDLGIYQDDGILRTGLYRAEYVTEEDGETRPKWISWVDPQTPTPNFHTPTSFGVLRLLP